MITPDMTRYLREIKNSPRKVTNETITAATITKEDSGLDIDQKGYRTDRSMNPPANGAYDFPSD